MTTTDALRTRMEGSLEVIERAVMEWEAAAKALDTRDWYLGHAWPQVRAHQPVLEEAVRTLTLRLSETPALPERALLRRLAVAQSRARRGAELRLSSLQRPDATQPDPLEALRSHLPITYLRWPTPPWLFGFLGVAWFLVAGVVILHREGAIDATGLPLLVATCGVLLVLARSHFPREPIILTRRRLRLGSWSMPSDGPILIDGTACRLTLAAGTRWEELEVGRWHGPSVDVRWVGRSVLTQLKESGVQFIGWEESGVGEDEFWTTGEEGL